MSTFNLRPVSDMGGQKILGMSGSLNGYINTGNAHDARYNQVDSVEISKNKKTKRKLKDFFTFAAVASGSAAAIILGKKGKLNGIKEGATKIFADLKTSFKEAKWPSKDKVFETLKKPFKFIQNGVSKLFKKSV